MQCVITQLWPGISSTCMQWCLHVCTIYIHHQSIQNHINIMIYQLLEGLYPSLHEQAHHVFANTLTCLLIETLLSRDLCPTYRQLPPDAARYIKQTDPGKNNPCRFRHGSVALTVMGMWHVGLLLPALVQAATPVNSGVAWKDFSVKKSFSRSAVKNKSIHFG